VSTTRHRCNICGTRHLEPKAGRAIAHVGQAVVYGVIESLAALQLSGWLAIALWVIVARNALSLALSITGLAVLAAETRVLIEDNTVVIRSACGLLRNVDEGFTEQMGWPSCPECQTADHLTERTNP